MNDSIRSPGYLGSKAASGAYQAIIGLMPPHNTYIETHLGSGAVFLRKPKAQRNIGIDIDSQTIRDFKANNPGEIDAEIYNCDCHQFIDEHDFDGSRTLIYSDPPYLPETRTSKSRYRHEYTVSQHDQLLDILRKVDAKVLLSGYPNKLYDNVLSGWNTHEFQVMTRGGVRTEKLWFSYEPDTSFWATYAGKDFTDRQRIKRKAQRWAKNYHALPAGERQAIMAEMLKAELDLA